ncbi:MAG: N-acetyl-gamma-glutamyl-phosphate reductase [Bernardetiaceae bacterium]|nr:N-acetyl-gamma-glutamyl-phosphate reductase [Bernardetiaceae bacterium]
MIKVGIVGGAGYTGGELIRILLNHPLVQISFVHSNSQAGKPVAATHPDLLGETDLTFAADLHDDVDALVLCVGHGEAAKFFQQYQFDPRVKIIDLSQDHRLAQPGSWPWVYGLPELNRDHIRLAQRVANPGCFATAIQLALLPLAAQGLLLGEVHVNATTGSTGAGQRPTENSHFSWRSHNLSVYKAFEHQHLAEIGQSLRQLQPGFAQAINFIPLRGSFTRGIFATAYLDCALPLEQAKALYQAYYQSAPFVHLALVNPDLKQVLNTNKCVLHLDRPARKRGAAPQTDCVLNNLSLLRHKYQNKVQIGHCLSFK